jgi:hypothetical protein
MGTLHVAVGDLNQIKRIVKLMVLVSSTAAFTEQHLGGQRSLRASGRYLEIQGSTFAAPSGWLRFRLDPVWKLNWSRSFPERMECTFVPMKG